MDNSNIITFPGQPEYQNVHSVIESEEEWRQQTSTRKQLVRAHHQVYHDQHMLATLQRQDEQNVCYATLRYQPPETSGTPATLQASIASSEGASNAVPEPDDHMYENWMIINRQSEMKVRNLIKTIFLSRESYLLKMTNEIEKTNKQTNKKQNENEKNNNNKTNKPKNKTTTTTKQNNNTSN